MTYTLFLTHWMVGWFNSSSNEWGLSLTKRETRNRQKNVINDSIKFLLHLPNTLLHHHHYFNRDLRWKVLKLLFSHISFFWHFLYSHKMASFWFILRVLLNFLHFICSASTFLFLDYRAIVAGDDKKNCLPTSRVHVLNRKNI